MEAYAEWWLQRARTMALSVNKDTGVYSGHAEEAEEAFTRAMSQFEFARALKVCTPDQGETLLLARLQAERERTWNRQGRVCDKLAQLEKVHVLSLREEARKGKARRRQLQAQKRRKKKLSKVCTR